MSKIEEVARAIWQAEKMFSDIPGHNDPSWQRLCELAETHRSWSVMRAQTLEKARVAVAAMRGATMEMLCAGGDAHLEHIEREGNGGLFCSRHCDLASGLKCGRPDDCGKTQHVDCYEAVFDRMISAALAEGPK